MVSRPVPEADILADLVAAGGDGFGDQVHAVSSWFVAAIDAAKSSPIRLPAWSRDRLGPLEKSPGTPLEADEATHYANLYYEKVLAGRVFQISKSPQGVDRSDEFLRASLILFEMVSRNVEEPENWREVVQVEIARRAVIMPPEDEMQMATLCGVTILDLTLARIIAVAGQLAELSGGGE